ncbi:MAG TPA: hypothetical protein VD996_12805 [Chitinophagaceae bacterium]|nr:hypothetical protein [Chitinophagaceae bacterium]
MAGNIILLTHADPFQQHQLHLRYIDVERSLKNAVLLFGRITLPGSSVLKSDLTYQLLQNARELLKQGLIVPDIRDTYRSFGNYVEDNKDSLKNVTDAKERAAFLDSNTQNVIPFTALAASDFLENNLASALFYLKLNGDLNVKWSDFTAFVDSIRKPQVSDRNTLLEKLNGIASPNRIVLSTTQAIYHTLGAFVTESHPIWPQLYSDTFSKIRAAQENAGEKIRKSKYAKDVMRRYKFIDSVQQLNAAEYKKVHTTDLSELNNVSFISNESLDALDWNDIIAISKSKTANAARKKLFETHKNADHIDLTALLKQEKKIKKDLSSVTNGITLSSIITGGAGCITAPPFNSAGLALSIVGLLLTFGDIWIKSELQKRLNSYSMLGEMIREKAYENRQSERLVRV